MGHQLLSMATLGWYSTDGVSAGHGVHFHCTSLWANVFFLQMFRQTPPEQVLAVSKKLPLVLVSQLFSCINKSKKNMQNAFLPLLFLCKHLGQMPWECPHKWAFSCCFTSRKEVFCVIPCFISVLNCKLYLLMLIFLVFVGLVGFFFL